MAYQYMGVAQSGSASGLGPEGQEFDSPHPYQLVDFVNREKFAAALSVMADIKYTMKYSAGSVILSPQYTG